MKQILAARVSDLVNYGQDPQYLEGQKSLDSVRIIVGSNTQPNSSVTSTQVTRPPPSSTYTDTTQLLLKHHRVVASLFSALFLYSAEWLKA